MKAAFAVRVYAIADFYEIEELQEEAEWNFRQAFETFASINHTNTITTLELVEERCNPNDSTLRDIVDSVLKTDMSMFLRNEAFRSFIMGHPELNLRLLTLFAESTDQAERPSKRQRLSSLVGPSFSHDYLCSTPALFFPEAQL